MQIDTIWLSETGTQGRRWVYIGVLGISLLFLAFTVIKRDTMKQYNGLHITIHCLKKRANYLGSSDRIYQAGGDGLVLH